MIEQAIKYVADQAVKHQKPETRHIEGDPNHVLRVFRAGEDVGRLDLDAPDVRIRCQTLAGLASSVKLHATEKSVLYYTTDLVELVFNVDDGYERATLGLDLSREARFILDAAKAGVKLFTVADLRAALRYTLHGAYDDVNLLKQVSNISFQDKNVRDMAAERGKESLGQTITNEVAESVSLPDELQTFNIVMWSNIGLTGRFPVQIILDPDPSANQWIVAPVQASVDEFRHSQLGYLLGAILKALESAGVDTKKLLIHNCLR